MKRLLIVFSILLTLVTVACTDQQVARQFGGMETIDLATNRKLINVTWKEDSLWILTRAMRPGEVPETYMFQEDSSFEIWEGTVYIVEHALNE